MSRESHIAWLPQGTCIWDFTSGTSCILKEPYVALVLEKENSAVYDVLYRDKIWEVAKSHVKLLGEKDDNQISGSI